MLILKYTTSQINSLGIIFVIDFDISGERLAGILIAYACLLYTSDAADD